MRAQFQVPAPLAPRPLPLWVVLIALFGLGIAVYLNSFQAAFVFDDHDSIVNNTNLDQSLGSALQAPDQSPLSGRPLVTATVVLNHALHGRDPVGYHVFNTLLHILSSFLLFGILHRTLSAPLLSGSKLDEFSRILALVMSAVWIVHPLLTESVTYITQRTELLMALFFLGTVYSAIRAWEPNRATVWSIVSVVSCAGGMLSKEVMVGAPLIVFLYDRAFHAGPESGEPGIREPGMRGIGMRGIWRQRWRLYGGLVATWILLAVLVVMGGRSRSAGFAVGLSPIEYGITQFGAILHYLRLSIWPDPLCFDYGPGLTLSFTEALPGLIIVGGLVVATLALWRRVPALHFAGMWFFVILAPTSSVVPIATEVMAEKRMYLPLASVIAVVVSVLFVGGHGAVLRWNRSPRLFGWIGIVAALLALVALGTRTVVRNRDYQTEESIWRATVASQPQNPRAHVNLSALLSTRGETKEAEAHLERALEIDPGYAFANAAYGNLLLRYGRFPEAIPHFEAALKSIPDYPQVHSSLGNALLRTGELELALTHHREAVRLRPNDSKLWNNYGGALLEGKRFSQALECCERAVELDDRNAAAHGNLGRVLLALDETERSLVHLNVALKLEPQNLQRHRGLANGLLRAGEYEEAIHHYRPFLERYPKDANTLARMGSALANLNRNAEALQCFRQSLASGSRNPQVLFNVGVLEAKQGNPELAARAYLMLLQLDPDHEATHINLCVLYDRAGNRERALHHLREARRVNPASEAVKTLGRQLEPAGESP